MQLIVPLFYSNLNLTNWFIKPSQGMQLIVLLFYSNLNLSYFWGYSEMLTIKPFKKKSITKMLFFLVWK